MSLRGGPNTCEAELLHVFRNLGSGLHTSIVGGGENAVILHYINNDQPLTMAIGLCRRGLRIPVTPLILRARGLLMVDYPTGTLAMPYWMQ